MIESISHSYNKVNIDATFDTLKLVKIYSRNAPIDLSKLHSNRKENCRWFQDGVLNLKYFQNKNNYKILVISCSSLSGMLYPSNIFPVSRQDEIDEALKRITDRASDLINYPFDAFQAKVIAVDANQDFFTYNKSYYLKAISNHELPRTKRHSYSKNLPLFDDSGLKLFNKSKSLLAYDKHRQLNEKHSELPEFIRDFALNLLRIEKGSEKHILRKDLI